MNWYVDFVLNNPSVQDAANQMRMYQSEIEYAKQISRDLQSFGFDEFRLPTFVPNLRTKDQSIIVPPKPKLIIPSELTLSQIQARLKDPNITPKQRKELLNKETNMLLRNPNLSDELRKSLENHLKRVNRKPPTNARERKELELARGYVTTELIKEVYAEQVGCGLRTLGRYVKEWKERGEIIEE